MIRTQTMSATPTRGPGGDPVPKRASLGGKTPVSKGVKPRGGLAGEGPPKTPVRSSLGGKPGLARTSGAWCVGARTTLAV